MLIFRFGVKEEIRLVLNLGLNYFFLDFSFSYLLIGVVRSRKDFKVFFRFNNVGV